ncbi:MAG: adenylate/guanylate cyclase domain-containing protein [Kiritimatiellae bacterium]|nr:adenylate/guanylate cyclase domain-containing protein [Kiritimatiellia bacterium]MDD5522791.1 adenylate/guanylate cyclase domain-containing protein [Kiritimatiellia bacterium]
MVAEERRLAAIMFSDICGYSKAMETDEKRALKLINLHNSVVQSGADQYGGRIIKTMGDGLLSEFSSAVNAVKAAVAVQEAISDYNRNVPEEERIFIRIGIHLGDVVVAGDDILGDGVNVASRIEPFAEPGGICISQDMLDIVGNKMEMQAVHIGAKELKNISRQMDIYKILIDAVSDGTHRRASDTQKTVRRKAGWSRRKKFTVAGIIVVVVLLLLAAGAMKRRALQRNAQRVSSDIPARTADTVKPKKSDKTLSDLNARPARLKEARLQAEINNSTEKLDPLALENKLKARCSAFFEAVQKEMWGDATAFVNPGQVNEIGRKNVEMKLRMYGGLMMKAGFMPKDNIRIKSVEFGDDKNVADVNVDIFVKNPENPEGIWREGKPSHWRLIDGEWYMNLGPGPKEGPQGLSGERPKPMQRGFVPRKARTQ